MAKKKDSEKHEDGQRGGKYNKDDADANELENFVDDITDEGKPRNNRTLRFHSFV